jgi:hypothetical protein
MDNAASGVVLQVEVSGCLTACLHCFAMGHPYPSMPLGDIERVVSETRKACDAAGLWFASSPPHEVLAHPDAPQVLRLFHELAGEAFDPMITTGVPIAIRDDWEDLLAAVEAVGSKSFCLTFHGVGEVHDRLVNRAGAFRESCLAVERIRARGFRLLPNIFLTKECLAQFDLLVDTLSDLGIDEASWASWEIASYTPTVRGRLYERSRPELEDILPHAERISKLTNSYSAFWKDVASHTEAAYTRRALDSEWPTASDLVYRSLMCRPNLDLFSGLPDAYGRRHGSMKGDDIKGTLQKALREGIPSLAEYTFGRGDLPSMAELAAKVGQADGRKVHLTPRSMYYRWLDLALRNPPN